MPAVPMTARSTRVLLVVVMTALAAAVLLGRWFSTDSTCGSPPTQEVRAQQEGFVTAHLPDASDFEWTVMDCDENGQVVLDFTTRQTGEAASKAFLLDSACIPSTEPEASAGDVSCRTGRLEVSIYLEDKGAVETDGELTWTPS